jgi:hypothetical protein
MERDTERQRERTRERGGEREKERNRERKKRDKRKEDKRVRGIREWEKESEMRERGETHRGTSRQKGHDQSQTNTDVSQ